MVLKDFYCLTEKKLYTTGDEYTGKRTNELADLGYVEAKPTKEKGKKDSEVVE